MLVIDWEGIGIYRMKPSGWLSRIRKHLSLLLKGLLSSPFSFFPNNTPQVYIIWSRQVQTVSLVRPPESIMARTPAISLPAPKTGKLTPSQNCPPVVTGQTKTSTGKAVAIGQSTANVIIPDVCHYVLPRTSYVD